MRPITFARGALLVAGLAMATGCTSADIAASTPRPTPAPVAVAVAAPAPAPAPPPVQLQDDSQVLARASRLWGSAGKDMNRAQAAINNGDPAGGCQLIGRAHSKAIEAGQLMATLPAAVVSQVEAKAGVNSDEAMGQADHLVRLCTDAGF